MLNFGTLPWMKELGRWGAWWRRCATIALMMVPAACMNTKMLQRTWWTPHPELILSVCCFRWCLSVSVMFPSFSHSFIHSTSGFLSRVFERDQQPQCHAHCSTWSEIDCASRRTLVFIQFLIDHLTYHYDIIGWIHCPVCFTYCPAALQTLLLFSLLYC